MPTQMTAKSSGRDTVVLPDTSFGESNQLGFLSRSRVIAKVLANDQSSMVLESLFLGEIRLDSGADGQASQTVGDRLTHLKRAGNTLLDARFFWSFFQDRRLAQDLLGRPTNPYTHGVFGGTIFSDTTKRDDHLLVLAVALDSAGEAIWSYIRLKRKTDPSHFLFLCVPAPTRAKVVK